jgi:hypothetical protein
MPGKPLKPGTPSISPGQQQAMPVNGRILIHFVRNMDRDFFAFLKAQGRAGDPPLTVIF